MQRERATVLIAEAESTVKHLLHKWLFEHELDAIKTGRRNAVVGLLSQHRTSLLVLGTFGDDDWNNIVLIKEIRQTRRHLPVILIVARSTEASAVAALKAGASDYFKNPPPFDDLVASIQRLLAKPLAAADRCISRQPVCSHQGHLIGESTPLRAIKEYIARVALTDASVLITGETGTGKEVAARLIHATSKRQSQRFVCINCAAIPDTLLESELFGYERGAFTGAHARNEGQLRHADKGTVFFDEIGDMSPYAQAKILRVIENKEVVPLGGQRTMPIDVRVIAATNRDLDESMTNEKFRKDLYFRINVARIHLPPLRERKEDIPLLADFFRRELNRQLGQEVEGFAGDAIDSLCAYDWPGNVRELKNVLESTYLGLSSRRISLSDMPERVRMRLATAARVPRDERSRLIAALVATNWNMSKAAQSLQWSRMTLYRKTAKYQITRKGTSSSGSRPSGS